MLRSEQQRDCAARPALCIIGASDVRLWSLPTDERLELQFARAGVSAGIDESAIAQMTGTLLLVRADAAIDQPLIAALIDCPNLVLLGERDGERIPLAAHVPAGDAPLALELLRGKQPKRIPSHLRICAPSQLGLAFWEKLRKREVPYALIMNERNRRNVEWRSFMGTYKGATDIVTKRLWPIPAFHATRALAALRVSPNLVTVLAGVLVLASFLLFLEGQYVLGLAAAWLMTFLDTVDGKLARTTLTSSKWGDVLDHGLDLIHPPFWYVAWGLGLSALGFQWTAPMLWSVLAVILAGYVLQRLMEGFSIKWLGLEIHIWRPIDTRFREITARRNPNLILLTLATIFGRPDLGLLAVAAWIMICLLLHGIQLAQAIIAKSRRGSLTSWMHEAGSSP
ncbi:MAG TPA: CDP-alcohol phosphatidyltransferase family protein [Aestuariivirgaceae bacterium]